MYEIIKIKGTQNHAQIEWKKKKALQQKSASAAAQVHLFVGKYFFYGRWQRLTRPGFKCSHLSRSLSHIQMLSSSFSMFF